MPFSKKKTGVLLINLGTPEATDYFSIRRYLKEFLSDHRIVNLPPILWKTILHLMILPRRPFITGRNYQRIWDEAKDGSPLRYYTRRQAELLAHRLADKEIQVEWAMRYGTPSVAEKIDSLQKKHCHKILILPLYPQYSATTHASALDAVYKHLLTLTNQPAITVVPAFAKSDLYLSALTSHLQKELTKLSFSPEKILLSFHGIPKKMAEKDYLYPQDCLFTAQKLREKMQLSEEEMPLTYQSRFGGAEWLQPYTVDTVKNLAHHGIKNLAIMAPGFFSDCLETLDELGREIKEIFLKEGGENFAVIPCLNDSEEAVNLLGEIICPSEETF
ncbi:ferrochelatase [Acetobacteraceae bacterium]|nr:ferrochelatase [Acetobacteraceae bacterium]